MTTVMFRPCVKFLFENHSYHVNNCFHEGERGKNENVWDDALFSAPGIETLGLFDLR